MKILMGLIFLFLITLEVRAETIYMTGNDLYSNLKEYKKNDNGLKSDPFAVGLALGYVQGVADSLGDREQPTTGFKFCIPKGITVSQLVDIVHKYLSEHPEARQYSANSLVSAAFDMSFPCK